MRIIKRGFGFFNYRKQNHHLAVVVLVAVVAVVVAVSLAHSARGID